MDELSEKEKQWLNKFTEEYVNANLDSKNLRKNLHKTKKLKKDCYDRNNARNRCILTQVKAQGKDVDLYSLKHEMDDFSEDKLIEDIDNLVIDLENTDDDSGNGK